MKVVFGTALSLLGFAANSLLCRMALGAGEIDAASFTTVRLASGAAALWIIVAISRKGRERTAGDWPAAAMLFAYAAAFSFAYVSLDAGVGALILFGAVQVTMIATALLGGERPQAVEWAGLGVALAGLASLMAPGLSAPSPGGSALMTAAGVAWGAYTLRGRRAGDALRRTRDGFLRAAPLAGVVSLAATVGGGAPTASGRGLLLAVVSGAVTSGAGYAVWYSVLPALTATRAATVQLLVPVLAAAAGVALLGEAVTPRLVGSAALILGGVGLALTARTRAGA